MHECSCSTVGVGLIECKQAGNKMCVVSNKVPLVPVARPPVSVVPVILLDIVVIEVPQESIIINA